MSTTVTGSKRHLNINADEFAGDLNGTVNTATTAVTQSANNNSTKVATTSYVDTAVSNLVDTAPSNLNTLNELAAALGDDVNFSTTVTNSIALKAPLASPEFTGQVGIGTAPASGVELHVNGEIRVDSTSGVATRQIRSSYFSSTSDISVLSGSSASVRLKNGNTDALVLDSSQNATFAGNNRVRCDNINW